jgi:hypothetical protein
VKVSLPDVAAVINDASSLIGALAPLVHEAMVAGRTDIPAQALADARARLTMNIEALDALLAERS